MRIYTCLRSKHVSHRSRGIGLIFSAQMTYKSEEPMVKTLRS